MIITLTWIVFGIIGAYLFPLTFFILYCSFVCFKAESVKFELDVLKSCYKPKEIIKMLPLAILSGPTSIICFVLVVIIAIFVLICNAWTSFIDKIFKGDT